MVITINILYIIRNIKYQFQRSRDFKSDVPKLEKSILIKHQSFINFNGNKETLFEKGNREMIQMKIRDFKRLSNNNDKCASPI